VAIAEVWINWVKSWSIEGILIVLNLLHTRSVAIRETLNGTERREPALAAACPRSTASEDGSTGAAEAISNAPGACCGKSLGPAHPKLAQASARWASFGERQRDYPQAQEFFRPGLSDWPKKHLGPTHQYTTVIRPRFGAYSVTPGPGDERLGKPPIRLRTRRAAFGEGPFLHFRTAAVGLSTPRVFGPRLNLWATMGAVRPLARAVFRTKGTCSTLCWKTGGWPKRASDPRNPTRARRVDATQTSPGSTYLDDLEPPSNNTRPQGRAGSESLAQQFEILQAALTRKVALSGPRPASAVGARRGSAGGDPGRRQLIEFLRLPSLPGKCEWQDSYGALLLSGGPTQIG